MNPLFWEGVGPLFREGVGPFIFRMSPSPYGFTLHLKRASQVEGTTKALNNFFPMRITDQRLYLFLWQNFPIWQKEKKKKKGGTTKPPNEFFPMRITDQRLFIFVTKFPHLAKGKKEKKRKWYYKTPK